MMPRRLIAKKTDKVLTAVRPNASVEAAYREPRLAHVAMNGKKYDVAKGMWNPAVKRWIYPGEEINFRCFSRSVVSGFS